MKESLLEQLETLDFKHIPMWVEQYVKNESPLAIPTVFEPAPSYSAEAASLNTEKVCTSTTTRRVADSGGQGGRVCGGRRTGHAAGV